MVLCCLIGCAVKFLSYAFVLALGILGLAYFLLKHNKSLNNKWFSFIYVKYISPNFKLPFISFKEKLFADLDKVVSNDPELRKENLFRLLEFGTGHGENLKHYPKNCRLISVEPNNCFNEYYEANKAQYPDLVVEKFVQGMAEDMRDIPDESVDVVVCTHVLCSVTNMDLVLKEVKRVLSKDGQFLLIEHVAAPTNTITFKIQQVVEPLWEVFVGGCHLTCFTEQKLKDTGFSKVEVENVALPLPSLIKFNIFGRAVK